MHSFFNGRRRKLGGVTLLMALLCSAGWVRGHVVKDVIQFGTGRGNVFHSLVLSHHGLMWIRAETLGQSFLGWTPGWMVVPIDRASVLYTDESRIVGDIKWRVSWWGFDFCDSSEGTEYRSSHRNIPYWPITLPLTLLSAYLLLWKRGKPIEKPSEKPVQTSVAFGAAENRKRDNLTLEELFPLVEHILREAFRQGKTTISTRAITQGLQVQSGVPLDCPYFYDAIQMMKRRKYIQYAHTPRDSPLWDAQKIVGPIYEIRSASRINPEWVPTWFDIYLEKLTETREKAVAKNCN